jgi:hypothetical protein
MIPENKFEIISLAAKLKAIPIIPILNKVTQKVDSKELQYGNQRKKVNDIINYISYEINRSHILFEPLHFIHQKCNESGYYSGYYDNEQNLN